MPDDRRRPPRSGRGSGSGSSGGGPRPPDDELHESLELLATVAASVSDRVEGQSTALDRMAKVLAETRTAAFAARKHTDPTRTADQVAAQVEHRLGHLLGDLRQSTTALGQKTATAGRVLDDLHAHAAGAKLTITTEEREAREWRHERRRLLLWGAPAFLALLLLTAALAPRVMAASEALCTLTGADWSPGGEYLSASCRFDAWW